MARRKPADNPEPTQEDEVTTTTTEPITEADVSDAMEATTATEPTATEPQGEPVDVDKLDPEELAKLLDPFMEAVSNAVKNRDETTGTAGQEDIKSVNAFYTGLNGTKLRNRAKDKLDDGMKDAMNSMDIKLARAYMDLRENLVAAKAKKAPKSKTERAPRQPANPTESFVERVATLNLAYNLCTTNEIPEGVDEDWQDKAAAAVGAAATDAETYKAYLLDDSEEKVEPDVSDLAKVAVKLSLGKSAKPGKGMKLGVGATVFNGVRRSIGKHIEEAFASSDSGTFLRIAEIGKFKSSEYGDDKPSAGAISARLFPSSGKCTLETVTPGTDAEGNKGARKN